MPSRFVTSVLTLLLLAFVACAPGEEQAEEQATLAKSVGQIYPNLAAPTVFENDALVAQRAVFEPGQWTGEHSHPGNQVVVVLTAATVIYREAGEETETTYEAGQIVWLDAVQAHDHTSKDASAEAIIVTLSDAPMGGGMAQEYPNIMPALAFENDRIIGQTMTSEPDDWAGEHSHDGNQLVVVLRGGTMIYRENGEETEVTYADGEVFWIDAVAAHDHAPKDAAIEAVIITVK